MNTTFVAHSKKAFSNILEGDDLEKFFTRSARELDTFPILFERHSMLLAPLAYQLYILQFYICFE